MTGATSLNAYSSWSALPDMARRALARGSVGRDHLVGLSAELLSLAASDEAANRIRLAALIQELMGSAWAANPLDGELARLCASQPWSGWPGLPENVDHTLKAFANFWRPPVASDPWWTLGSVERRDSLLGHLEAEPKNLFWKAEAWAFAWPRADWVLADLALRPEAWPRTLTPVRLQATAQALLARGEASDALDALSALDSLGAYFPGNSPGLRAECLLRLGREAEAVDLLAGSLARAPWRTSEVLRLSDLVSGAARETLPVPGCVAVLLYTWNKAQELDETLASLAASDLGAASDPNGVRIWVLDNGSSDATPQVLSDWQARLGTGLTVLRLPVNIGAPAARNWLLSVPEVRSHDFLVFLDDDVALPAGWLGRLGSAAVRFPEASVWGCRVVDEANPLVVQSVDYVPQAASPDTEGGKPLSLPTLHQGQPDLGQFTYLRPCVSVTGCCHLLRTADIDRTGGFDIRFSPSQYDDLERDLRVSMGGGHAVYQGHLAVGHKRNSGQMAERSPAEIGNATANTHKLLTKHAASDLAGLCLRGEALLERDMERRFSQLQDLLPKV